MYGRERREGVSFSLFLFFGISVSVSIRVYGPILKQLMKQTLSHISHTSVKRSFVCSIASVMSLILLLVEWSTFTLISS